MTTSTLPGALRWCVNKDGNAALPGMDLCVHCQDQFTEQMAAITDLPTPEDFQAQARAAIPEGIDPDRPTGKARKRPSGSRRKPLDMSKVDMSQPGAMLEVVQAELSQTQVPHPDLFMAEYSPHASLYFLRQVAMSALNNVQAANMSLAVEGETEAPTALETLACAMACVKFATQGLVALEVLPAEALTALEEVLNAT